MPEADYDGRERGVLCRVKWVHIRGRRRLGVGFEIYSVMTSSSAFVSSWIPRGYDSVSNPVVVVQYDASGESELLLKDNLLKYATQLTTDGSTFIVAVGERRFSSFSFFLVIFRDKTSNQWEAFEAQRPWDGFISNICFGTNGVFFASGFNQAENEHVLLEGKIDEHSKTVCLSPINHFLRPIRYLTQLSNIPGNYPTLFISYGPCRFCAIYQHFI